MRGTMHGESGERMKAQGPGIAGLLKWLFIAIAVGDIPFTLKQQDPDTGLGYGLAIASGVVAYGVFRDETWGAWFGVFRFLAPIIAVRMAHADLLPDFYDMSPAATAYAVIGTLVGAMLMLTQRRVS